MKKDTKYKKGDLVLISPPLKRAWDYPSELIDQVVEVIKPGKYLEVRLGNRHWQYIWKKDVKLVFTT